MAWALGALVLVLGSCLLGYLVEAAGEEAERRKERSGERGREQSTCGLAPWSWSSAPASWAPWWKLLVRKRRRGRKGPAEDPPESEKKGRERLDGGCPPPPTFRCAAALSPFSLLSLSESQLSPFPRAGHPSARAPPRAGRAFPRAPPAPLFPRALLPRCDMASSSTREASKVAI